MAISDIVIMVASMGLNVAILPTLFSSKRPPIATSLGFTVCVLAIGVALLSVGFWLGGASNVLGGLLWGAVSLRSIRDYRSS